MRKSGDDGGGAKVRQQRPVGEEAASRGGRGQIRQSRDEWGQRGRQAAVGEGGNVGGGGDDRWGRRRRRGVGRWRRRGRATSEREQKLGGRETGIEAGRGGDKTWTRLGRLESLLDLLLFLHHRYAIFSFSFKYLCMY